MLSFRRNIANYVTFSRILGVGFIFWLTPFTSLLNQMIVIVIYALISLTDLLDGWLARRLKTVSETGKLLDPLADKILVLVFLPLLEMQAITAFPVFLILAREFAVMAFRVVMAQKGQTIEAQFSGKLKTAITFPICGILLGTVVAPAWDTMPTVLVPFNLLITWVQSWPSWIILFLIWGMVMVTVWSFFDYLKDFFLLSKPSKPVPKEERHIHPIWGLAPNALTLFNLIFGLLSVYFSAVGKFDVAILLIYFGFYLDGYDGRLARKLQVDSKFGAKLDSKADMVSFGIAPAVLIVMFLLEKWANYFWPAICIGVLYFACVQYRLYRFDQAEHSSFFQGIPSPAGAIFVLFLCPIFAPFVPPVVFASGAVFMSLMMVSTFSYPHGGIIFSFPLYRWIKLPALVLSNAAILLLFFEKGIWMTVTNGLFLIVCLFYIVYPVFDKLGILGKRPTSE